MNHMNHITDELVIIFLWLGISQICNILMQYFKLPIYCQLSIYILLVTWMTIIYHNKYILTTSQLRK